MMVSEPNQVAKVTEAAKIKGRRLPANTKSVVVDILLDAQRPIPRFNSKYTTREKASIQAGRLRWIILQTKVPVCFIASFR